MRERWRDVVGAEGRYQVSNLGRVRSIDHRCRIVIHGVETTRAVPGRVLRPGSSKSGHLSVAIGKGNSRRVHQLVMEAFKGPCPEGYEVLHKNHNPANNRKSNLRYGTRSENIKADFIAGNRKVHASFIGARWHV